MAGSAFKLGKIQSSKNDITSAAGTTTLTNTSDYFQYVTGSSTQTIQLPDATTMATGVGFSIVNANSAGNVTITNNGSSTILILQPGQSVDLILDSISTSNGVWITAQGSGSAGATWTDVTGTSQTLAANNGYIADNASLVTFTLPATAAFGDTYYIVGRGAGGWQINQNSGQQIYNNTSGSAVGTAGGIASGNNRACITLVCVSANTEFEVINYNGTVNIIAKVYGYCAGGNTSQSEVDTVAYSNDTVANVGNILSYAVTASSSNTYSNIKGYLMGNNASNSGSTNIESLVFNSNTSATLSATLSSSRANTAGGGYSSAKAYQFGGYGSGSNSSAIDALTFSGETVATLGATLVNAYNLLGNSQSSAKVYLAGGQNYAGNTAYGTVQAFTLSGESMASISATLSSALTCLPGVYSSTKGYYMGGYNYFTQAQTVINALTFSGETATTISASLPNPNFQAAPNSSSTKGYIMGGYNTSSISAVVALTFSGETTATLSGTLGNARGSSSGF